MTVMQSIITILAVALGTMLTRFLPFVVFPDSKNPPQFITYLGTVFSLRRYRSSGCLQPERLCGYRQPRDSGNPGHPVYHRSTQVEEKYASEYQRGNCIVHVFRAGGVLTHTPLKKEREPKDDFFGSLSFWGIAVT